MHSTFAHDHFLKPLKSDMPTIPFSSIFVVITARVLSRLRRFNPLALTATAIKNVTLLEAKVFMLLFF